MHKAIHDQASGLRHLMCLQTVDNRISKSLMELLSDLDGLGIDSLQRKLNELKVPVIKLLDNYTHKAPLDLLNFNKIVLYMNETSESIKAAYVVVKLLSQSEENRELGFLIQANCPNKSKKIFQNITMAANSFQQIHPTYLGCLISGNTYIRADNSDM